MISIHFFFTFNTEGYVAIANSYRPFLNNFEYFEMFYNNNNQRSFRILVLVKKGSLFLLQTVKNGRWQIIFVKNHRKFVMAEVCVPDSRL